MSAFRTTCVCATGAYRAVAATGDVTQGAMPATVLRIAANLKAERGPGPRDDGWRASKSSRATVWQSAQPLCWLFLFDTHRIDGNFAKFQVGTLLPVIDAAR
ncbi:hypothetical protein XcvCFBP7113P_00440 [Xanthomonas citri pv. vignicola]|nr:hypothetical protein XcvCFBP7113P_00440 [Xanthomonas citri pv. vignicola]